MSMSKSSASAPMSTRPAIVQSSITATTQVTKKIDPVTRVEGHLSIKIQVENSKITNAWSSGLLYRGFERILLRRDPRDAPILTQRICGVCHAVHRLTSILALENATNIIPTPDAVRLRNIEQGVNFVYSHAVNIFVLAGPDYDLYGLVPDLSQGKNIEQYHTVLKDVILPAQRLCHEVGAIFGGRTPHHMTTLPGGITCKPTQNAIDAALEKITAAKNIFASYAPVVLDYLDAQKAEMEAFGGGSGNFLAYGAFDDPLDPKNPSKYLFKRGVYIDGTLRPLDVNKITEAVKYSWYTDASGGNPAMEIPPQDYYGKSGAYSWIKSPRYEGYVLETGPLARMAVSGYYRKQASLYDRVRARVEEMVLVLNNVEKWITELTPNASVYVPYENPKTATGIGLWEAPRGANGHWVSVQSERITHYQIVSPTAWNASPRDDMEQMGPIEQALIGAPIADPQKPISALKTARSFDPCLDCSIH